MVEKNDMRWLSRPMEMIISRTVQCDNSLRTITTWRFYAALGALLFGLWTALNCQSGRISSTPRFGGDEIDYDCIAVQIWKRHEFANNYNDADYLAAYAAQSGYNTFVEDVAGRHNGPTTARPPLLPAIMGASYSVFGRTFIPVRIFNTAAAAATVSLAAWLCRAFAGPIASFFAVGLMCWTAKLPDYGASILTESFSAMVVGVCVLLMSSRLASRPRSTSLALGIVWGLAVLMRTSFVLWLPPLLAGVFSIVVGAAVPDCPSRITMVRRGVAAGCLVLAGMLAVVAPWGVRNCVVLDALMPLGAQGMIGLPSGFSDAAVEHRGVWFPFPEDSFFNAPLSVDQHATTEVEFERAAADYARKYVAEWIRANPSKLPALTFQKIWGEWKPSATSSAFVLFAALFGAAFLRGSPFFRACMTMFCGDIVMIACTWSVEGRFVFPVVVPLVALAGVGSWLLFRFVTDLREDLWRRTGVGPGDSRTRKEDPQSADLRNEEFTPEHGVA